MKVVEFLKMCYMKYWHSLGKKVYRSMEKDSKYLNQSNHQQGTYPVWNDMKRFPKDKKYQSWELKERIEVNWKNLGGKCWRK